MCVVGGADILPAVPFVILPSSPLCAGDLGRSSPSLGHLLGCRAQIVSLDVEEVHMRFGAQQAQLAEQAQQAQRAAQAGQAQQAQQAADPEQAQPAAQPVQALQ